MCVFTREQAARVPCIQAVLLVIGDAQQRSALFKLLSNTDRKKLGSTQAMLADFRARGGRLLWVGNGDNKMNGNVTRQNNSNAEEERKSSPFNWDRRVCG